MTRFKTFGRTRALALIAAGLIAPACHDVTSTEPLPPLTPASADASAGNWRMLVLTGPGQIVVPPPADVSSDAYKSELAAIKAAQANLTDEQKAIIDYWSGGGILRWNQILRELVAKYNLPPAPRADGSYIFPDAANPFADPAFPFSNPPYAARAYSYVSVAQFEALKSAWSYMYQYNRPSPARVDSGVQSLMSATDMPAYPSYDAVMSGVSADMLQLLFPAAVEEITRKGGDQRNAALPPPATSPPASPSARPWPSSSPRAPPATGCGTRLGPGRSGTPSPPPRRRRAKSPGSARTRRPAPRCCPSSARCGPGP
jgi:hypothetical protein